MKSTIEHFTGISRKWLEDFTLLSNVDDNIIKSNLEKQKRRLSNIYDKHLGNVKFEVSKLQVDELLKQLKNSYDREIYPDWTIRNLQTIAYNLFLLNNEDDMVYFKHALHIIDENWNDRLINGLISTLIRMWNRLSVSNRDAICELLIKKLSEYKGSRTKFVRLKESTDLLCDAGPIRLAAILKHKNIPLEEAPRQLGFGCDTVGQSYFSDTILKYYRGYELKKIDEIVRFIVSRPQILRTKQLLSCRIIALANSKCDEVQQDKISNQVQNILRDDITQATTWNHFQGATDKEKKELCSAHEIIKQWAVRKVLNVFFEVCVQDYSRKIFWRDYVSVISNFEIVGSAQVKAKLNNDSRITKFMQNHFSQTDQRTSETAALVLYIKNKIIIEFSDVGAVYVYNNDNKYINQILNSRMSINKTDDLKITSLGNLIEQGYSYNTYYEEGRMNHRGDWRTRLASWMRNKLDINV